jgi:hypothetical protein
MARPYDLFKFHITVCLFLEKQNALQESYSTPATSLITAVHKELEQGHVRGSTSYKPAY